MKNIMLSVILVLLTTSAFGQFHISTNSRVDYKWNETNSEWEFDSKDEESITFLELDQDF